MFIDQWTKIAPKHWTRKKLKHVAALRSGESITADSIKEEGDFPVYGGNGLRGYTDKYTHEGEFVLIGRQGALCGNVNYARGRFWASEHAVVVTRLGDDDLTWLGELLRYLDLNRLSQSAAQPGISAEEVSSVLLAVPPIQEQRAISAYLKAETAWLDALVAAKQRLIDLLAEKRKAIIATAVTRGLDPKVKLRDSGVPWLGEIPAHWQLLKFGWCVTIVEGQVDPEDDEFSVWPLIAPNHVESGTGRLLALESAADQGAVSGKYQCRPDDVIYSKIRPALRKATLAPKACLCSADMYPMRVVRERLTPEYLLHYLLTDAFSVWAVLESNRVAMPKINRESFIELRMPVPPLDQQRTIVEHIARETTRLDAVRAATERTIALLKERRTALIAAAVTGQLDTGAAK